MLLFQSLQQMLTPVRVAYAALPGATMMSSMSNAVCRAGCRMTVRALTAVAALLAFATPTFAQTYDLVVQGGRVMDRQSGLDAIRNVGIDHGKIVRHYGRDGKPSPLERVREGYGHIAIGHSELNGGQHWGSALEYGKKAGERAAAML